MEEQPKGSYEIIHPPNTLKHKVKVTGGGGGLDPVAIQRAENALAKLSGQFDNWLSDEITKLKSARVLAHEKGINEDTLSALFHASHDIKGQGTTLGYPLVTVLCTSLCKLLEVENPAGGIPLALIDQHVDAVIAVHREKMTAPDHPVGSAVAEKLLDVVLEFVDREMAAQAAAAEAAAQEAADDEESDPDNATADKELEPDNAATEDPVDLAAS